MSTCNLFLIASSDDFLLEESVGDVVAGACAVLGGVEPDWLPDQITPEALAVELFSPSLFSPTRVLVVAEVRPWLDAKAPAGAPELAATGDVEPLVETLGKGLPEGVALVLGAWCSQRPKGPLVDAVEQGGEVRWVAVPEPPKPWEDTLLSRDQCTLLRGLLARTASEVRFDKAAETLLMDRLGFAPRLLVSEVRKLAAAVGAGGTVDEELVRTLTFPRERSLEVVKDAVLERDATALLDLIGAAGSGVPVRDWQGRRIDPDKVAGRLFGQISNLLEQLLYLRQVAVALGMTDEMAPSRTGGSGWYNRRFKERLAPPLIERLKEESPSPATREGKPPTPWKLSGLFVGAGRYRDDELVAALAEGGAVEASLRGDLPLEGLSAWIGRILGPKTES